MKKYPKAWLDVAKSLKALDFIELMGAYNVRYTYLNPEDVLARLDAAGMLKDVPEPVEFEWCSVHNCFTKYNESDCDYIGHQIVCGRSLNKEEKCEFVKLRGVDE